MLVISPYAKQGFVSHVQLRARQHPASSSRISSASAGWRRATRARTRRPADCFDFTQLAAPVQADRRPSGASANSSRSRAICASPTPSSRRGVNPASAPNRTSSRQGVVLPPPIRTAVWIVLLVALALRALRRGVSRPRRVADAPRRTRHGLPGLLGAGALVRLQRAPVPDRAAPCGPHLAGGPGRTRGAASTCRRGAVLHAGPDPDRHGAPVAVRRSDARRDWRAPGSMSPAELYLIVYTAADLARYRAMIPLHLGHHAVRVIRVVAAGDPRDPLADRFLQFARLRNPGQRRSRSRATRTCCSCRACRTTSASARRRSTAAAIVHPPRARQHRDVLRSAQRGARLSPITSTTRRGRIQGRQVQLRRRRDVRSRPRCRRATRGSPNGSRRRPCASRRSRRPSRTSSICGRSSRAICSACASATSASCICGRTCTSRATSRPKVANVEMVREHRGRAARARVPARARDPVPRVRRQPARDRASSRWPCRRRCCCCSMRWASGLRRWWYWAFAGRLLAIVAAAIWSTTTCSAARSSR